MLLTESHRQNLLLVVTVLALVCFFSSFLLFVCAAYVKITIDSQMRLLETYNSDVLPAIFVAVGVINMCQNVALVVVAFKLMTIDLRDSYVKSMKFILITGIVLVIFEVVCAITSFAHIGILDREFGEGIRKAMDKYIEGGELKQEMDSVQMEYTCCGDKSYVDWFRYEWNLPSNLRTYGASIKKYLHTDGKYYSDDAPFSCCDPRSPRPCIHHHIHDISRHHNYDVNVETTLYVTGCRITLMAIYGKVLLTVGLVATFIACLKTTVLLLFRLLETSLSKAQLLEDWEAMTNGYIYKDDPNAESQSVKVKVSEEDEITEAETTEAETTEVDTTEAETTDAGDETAPDDVNENKRLLKKQGPRKHRSRSSRGNQNMSCVSPVESPRSRRVTDELCQRFLYPGRTRPTQSDTIGLDQRIVDNIRRHMSRTSLASSGHNIYQYNNNCRIAALTEDSSINSSGDDSQSRDCKPDEALLSTSPNASSKKISKTRTKKLASLKSKEEDLASYLQDVPEKEINRSKDLSSCCVVKSPDIEFRVENELRYGGQSREDEKTIDGREIRTRSNRSLPLSPDSSSTSLSDSSSTSLSDSSSASSDSSSSYSSSDLSSSSPESSSASSSSSLTSVSSSYTSTASSSPSSGPAPHAAPSGAVDEPLSGRSNQPPDATTAHPGSTAEVGVWNEDDCWYSNGNDGYMTDSDRSHTFRSYQTDANQSYVGHGYPDVNQMHTYHGYMTDANHAYMTDVNHAYMTDVNHAYMTDVNHAYMTDVNHAYMTNAYHGNLTNANHGYMTDVNHGYMTDANHGYMTDVNHGYMTDVDQRHAYVSFLTDLEIQEYLMTDSGQKAICYKSDGVIDGQEGINEMHLCPATTPSNGQRILDTNNILTKLSSELNKPTSLCKSKCTEPTNQILMGSHFTKEESFPQITPTNGVIGSIDNVLKVLSLHQTDLDKDDLGVTAISGEGQLLTNDHAALSKSGETVQISPASPVLKQAGVHLRSLLIKPQRTHIRSYCKLNNITTLPVITSSLFPAPIESVCRSVRLTRQRSRTLELENTDTVLKIQPLTVDQSDSIVGQSDLNFGQCDSTIDQCDSTSGQCDLINGKCDSTTGQCNSIVVQSDFPVSQPDSTSSDLCDVTLF